MQNIDTVLRAIEAKATSVGLSKWGLAEFAGLHKNSLQGMFTDKWTPSISTIRRLEDALRAPVGTLRELAAAKGIALKKPGETAQSKRATPSRRRKSAADKPSDAASSVVT